MNDYLLNIDIQDFINNNLNSDISSILLKGTSFLNVKSKEIVEQIESKKRCEKKLPTWFNTQNIYFPNKLNIEQTSSEVTAQYKSSLINGNTIIDLTGGFGVDCYYFSKKFNEVIHCEINKQLSEIVSHNNKIFSSTSIKTVNCDGIDYLLSNKATYDWIYIDPSRRHDSKGKVFFLNDCLPNVPEHINLVFEHSKNVIIKTSPLLDISVGVNELKFVKEIHVVAFDNEVKELLWILEFNYLDDIEIFAVNLKKSGDEKFSFKLNSEINTEAIYSEPLNYIFEPNAAILKSGAFKSVSKQLNIFKLHKNTHLYTHEFLIDFPGRRFKIENIIPYSKQNIKSLVHKKANITTRNFPETVSQLRKKFNINDGGNTYLFFTTNIKNEKIVLICSKIES